MMLLVQHFPSSVRVRLNDLDIKNDIRMAVEELPLPHTHDIPLQKDLLKYTLVANDMSSSYPAGAGTFMKTYKRSTSSDTASFAITQSNHFKDKNEKRGYV